MSAVQKVVKQPYNSYLIEGELHLGVSTILNIESAGDFLIPWALRTFASEPDPLAAHKAYMERVSGLGTQIHHYIEADLKGLPADHLATPETIDAIESYLTWKKDHEIEVIATELTVSNMKWRVAGTLDAVLKIDGKLCVADWKTGSFKARYFTQLAAYWGMLCNQPKKKKIADIEDAELTVLTVPRDGGPVETVHLAEHYHGAVTKQDEFNTFHALRYIWGQRNFKSRMYQPIVKAMEDVISPMENNFFETFIIKQGKEK